MFIRSRVRNSRQVLSAARGVAIHQSSKADLVCNSEARQTLDNDTAHDAKHGSAAIEKLNVLALSMLICGSEDS